MNHIYSQTAFAALVGVPVTQVSTWVRRGDIPSVKLGQVRYVKFAGVAK